MEESNCERDNQAHTQADSTPGYRCVPEIRFRGFTYAWERQRLGELLLFQNGFNGSSESFGSGVPLISVMDVLDDEFITHETVRGKARLNCEEASRYCVEYGDVLFQRSSENQEDAGTSNVYLDQHVSSAFGGFVIRGKKVGEYNPIFIKYLLGSSSIREQITHRAQGAQHINVSQDTLADVVLLMPSMREQEAVGLVFLHLDSLVTLHQRKLNKLHTIKKALLEKMFPKDGADVPEVRFKGFTGAWKRKRFSELYESVIQKNDLTYGVDKNITVASMQYRPDIKVTDIEYLRTYNVLKLGDIVFEGHQSKEFRYGRFVENDIGDGIVSHIFAVFRPKTDYDLMFWKYAINNERIMRPVLVRCTKASTMMNDLVSKDFLEESILVPGIEEQKKIGTVLSEIDRLISLQQEELKKLQSFKKALLEKMFV